VRYPIAIEVGDKKHAYGVVVPDLPGCISAGDTLEEAFALGVAFAIEHPADVDIIEMRYRSTRQKY